MRGEDKEEMAAAWPEGKPLLPMLGLDERLYLTLEPSSGGV